MPSVPITRFSLKRPAGLCLALLLYPVFACGQDAVEARGYLTSPLPAAAGTVFSDNYGSTISVAGPQGIRTLVSARGCGWYWSLSPDGKRVGYKRILDNGLQVPEVVDITTGAIEQLLEPAPLAGQVSFALDGAVAFTLGSSLVVVRGPGRMSYDLGVYANIVPLSPDGTQAAFADAGGRVWVVNLSSGSKRVVAPEDQTYGLPVWAPDGEKLLFSTLDCKVLVCELASGHIYELGEAFAPAWSPDGEHVVYYNKEILQGKLVNSDLYSCRFDGTGTTRLTSTPEVCEMDPAVDRSGSVVTYHTYAGKKIQALALGTGRISEVADGSAMTCRFYPEPENTGLHKTTTLDIPYVNQVYDTPDWFNGHWACGPTTSAMLLAHYSALPPWPGWCSWPSGHMNPWGRYVADRYRFRESDYTWQADDPNGKPGQGGYGYMWGNGSPHSYMASYYQRHGLTALTTDNPPLQTAIDEVQAGRPYSICVGLTSAGHIVLAHGYAGNGTFVTNDPYGDKNKPGYPNIHGKDAYYDWPGWNNGHVNLSSVYWAVSAAYASPAVADTLVDDLQFSSGFYLYNQAPVSMATWKDFNKGFAGHFWYVFTHAGGAPDSCYATWTPNLPRAGSYEVFAYVPYSNATAAHYKISTLSGQQVVEVNQKPYRDTWVSLGTFDFAAGNGGVVRLGDASSADRQELVFDAVRWSYRGVVSGILSDPTVPTEFVLWQNYPNPFNPTTVISGQWPVVSDVKLVVCDLLGREVAVLADGRYAAGRYEFTFEAGGLPSGVYLYRLTAGTYVQTRRMLLVK